ncbi:hypothetical protein GCM10018793_58310 [Streptomyces sulfonofaciens]|uniref:Uncharacterized protein n=1 Tax=Streptomyces sulfonofaciens TaxID=68272 RepID=A0A919GKD1_9ACTN|nr:DUF6256 family protein [Streptomyces sulfonofaciens]GHH86435.1 hypothetical protein GCM10018793_58310 [Streptomyces sulfonofaciens]
MLPVPLNISLMLVGYLLTMGYLAIGLCLSRRNPSASWRPSRRFAPASVRRGWPGLIRQVVGTAVGGYVLLMAVVIGYYDGVAGEGAGFTASAFEGAAALVAITLPVFFTASWAALAVRRRWGRRSRR